MKSPSAEEVRSTEQLQAAFGLLRACGVGELAFFHGIEVARLLDRWYGAPALLAAGLLHESVAEGRIGLDDVEQACGPATARLCADYAQRIVAPPPANWRGRPAALRRVRLYAAAYQSLDLALLCVAHMWHSVTFTLAEAGASGGPPSTSLSMGRGEAVSVLIPLLDMLGLRQLRDDLESYLREPQPALVPAKEARTAVDTIRARLGAVLPGATIRLREGAHPVAERAHLAGERTAGAAAEKQQSLAVEVVVPTPEGCYEALHLLHHAYRPIAGAVADTVAVSTRNGHRSLQTAVVTQPGGKPVRLNIQIATPEMEWVNRWGVAAFALERCRAAAPVPIDFAPYRDVWWSRDAASGSGGAALAVRLDAQPAGSLGGASVIVFSPQGEPFEFEAGSTVVDYAYSVHSDLAEQCQRFFVNGESVEPATVLRHLDLVELEHHPRAPGPTVAWLNAARTKRARARIRRTLRRQSEGTSEGRRIIEARLHALEEYYGFHIPDHRIDEAVARSTRQHSCQTAQEYLGEIAAGRIAVDRLLYSLFAEEIVRRIDLPRTLRLRPHQIVLAQCCKPRPGDDIAGLPARRGDVLTRLTVHCTGCARYQQLPAEVRAGAVALRWLLRPPSKVLVQLEVTARNEDGLLGAALQAIYAELPHVTLLKTDATQRRGTARLRFSLEAECQESIDEIADALRRLPNREVSAVRQLALPPSEQEALHADGAAGSNPYSRMPVHDRTMFFGRAAELDRLNDWVRNNVTCIWLRGQKRVGKTSLLLHLRHHFWEPHELVCAFVDFQNLSNLAQANVFYEVAAAVYHDLEQEPRVAALGAPDRALFESQPPTRLLAYLRDIQQRLGTRRLVVLIDEFSRITDLYLQGKFAADFFSQWRSLLQLSGRFVSFVTVVQQKTFEHMLDHMRSAQDDPCWHVLELGETMHLKPFDQDDARRLISWPMRNFMNFGPGTIDSILRLTGGSPFLIQSFCNKLVAQISRQNGDTVELPDVEQAAEQFMQPSESIFAHLLDLAPGLSNHVLTEMAAAGAEGTALDWSQVCAGVPAVEEALLRRTLAQLCTNDILNQPGPEGWQFTSTLFQRWLARNA